MAKDFPTGANRRKTTGAFYFEMRYSDGHGDGFKLYSTKIKSAAEGGLCYDIAQRYSVLETGGTVPAGGKRKAPLNLNYQEYSLDLQLEALPSGFDFRANKKAAMDIILRQAQEAAKNLPKSLKHSTPVVGSESPSDQISSLQHVQDKPPRVMEAKQGLSNVCTSNNVRKLFREISKHSAQCGHFFSSKVNEKAELERKVADINEDSGIISLPKRVPDKFHHHMACLEQLISSGETIDCTLDEAKQAYQKYEFECLELREILKGHNLKSIPGSLMGHGNEMTGRQRAHENDRLPKVLENFPPGEQDEFSMANNVSTSYGSPASPLAVITPCETEVIMPSPAEIDMSQRMATHEFASGDKSPSITMPSPVEMDMSQRVPTHEFASGEKFSSMTMPLPAAIDMSLSVAPHEFASGDKFSNMTIPSPAEMYMFQREAPHEFASADKITDNEAQTDGVFLDGLSTYSSRGREEDQRPAEGCANSNGPMSTNGWIEFLWPPEPMDTSLRIYNFEKSLM